MTDAKTLIYEAIAKLNMARELDIRLEPDIANVEFTLREALRAIAPSPTGVPTKASKPKSSGTKPKPRIKDDFEGCHGHD